MNEAAPKKAGGKKPAKPSAFWNQYASDPDLDENGAWIDFGEGTEIRIRSNTSVAVQERLEELYRPYRDESGEIPPEIDRRLTADWVATSIIVDWRNLEDPENLGMMIPYSRERAIEICTNPQHRRFVVRCLNESRKVSNFRTNATRTRAGN